MCTLRCSGAILAAVASLACGSTGDASGFGGAGGSSPAASAGSTASSASSGGASNGSGGSGGQACAPVPACDAPPPDPGSPQGWNDPLTPILVTSQGSPQHRGRDLILNPGDPQWVLAKFAYGVLDKDLKGEDVDIYLLRGCSGDWEHLGTATSSQENEQPTVEGVEDTGGRIYFRIPAAAELALGRHRIHLVVRGDLSTTDLFIEVLSPDTPVFVSDVDGTLTTAETEEFTDLLVGQLPNANPSAAEALSLLAEKGVRPFYLTARPEWLTGRTRAFLEARGFPPGIVHTTLSKVGALGGEAVIYKSGELAALTARTPLPTYAFGNTDSDGEAYDLAGVQPLDQRVFFQFDDPFGGRRIESYAELLPELAALAPACP